jgi:hypothetical protein
MTVISKEYDEIIGTLMTKLSELEKYASEHEPRASVIVKDITERLEHLDVLMTFKDVTADSWKIL